MGLFSTCDEFLFGPPGQVSGLLGTPINYALENPGKAALVVAATLVTGGLATVAAPTIAAAAGSAGLLGAASTGTVISSLSGAPLTNASLAAVGGGALAVGGGGMAAGTAVITGAGAAVGGASASVAATFIGDDDYPLPFSIESCRFGLGRQLFFVTVLAWLFFFL